MLNMSNLCLFADVTSLLRSPSPTLPYRQHRASATGEERNALLTLDLTLSVNRYFKTVGSQIMFRTDHFAVAVRV
jgi:hypothetical protein